MAEPRRRGWPARPLVNHCEKWPHRSCRAALRSLDCAWVWCPVKQAFYQRILFFFFTSAPHPLLSKSTEPIPEISVVGGDSLSSPPCVRGLQSGWGGPSLEHPPITHGRGSLLGEAPPPPFLRSPPCCFSWSSCQQPYILVQVREEAFMGQERGLLHPSTNRVMLPTTEHLPLLWPIAQMGFQRKTMLVTSPFIRLWIKLSGVRSNCDF